jgi:metal-dependent amidase/aminoacylase/carboxypeptidase family protein
VVGSTDMGNVSHLVPSIHPMVCCAPAGTAIHTSDFAAHARKPVADRAVIDGAIAMALTGIDFWVSERLRGAVREEFERTNPSRDVL